jgi:hypothetical protein
MSGTLTRGTKVAFFFGIAETHIDGFESFGDRKLFSTDHIDAQSSNRGSSGLPAGLCKQTVTGG